LSRHTMEQLKIISQDFSTIGAAASMSDSATRLRIIKDSSKTSDRPSCEFPKRKLPPVRPKKLPFDLNEGNNEKMKQWLLERYSTSTFNQCPHQPLPMMTGPLISITVNSEATPTAVHTPAPIPIH